MYSDIGGVIFDGVSDAEAEFRKYKTKVLTLLIQTSSSSTSMVDAFWVLFL